MPSLSPLDDAAVEALLAGRTSVAATGETGPLAAFVDDLRAAADGGVPQPRPELATLMTNGLPPEQGPEGLSTAPSAQVAGLPKWRKTTMSVPQLIAGLAAKLAGMGMAAKAALGLGAVAAGMTSAAAVGVLPDAAQHAVASVVNPVSPFNVPDGGGSVETGADEDDETGSTTTSTPSTTLPGGDDDGDDDGDDGQAGVAGNHGACVSDVARTAPRGPGGVHGQAVSEAARSDCGKDEDDSTTSTSVPSTTSTSIDADDEEVSSNSGPGSHNRGPGHSGSGNSGSGNSGSGNGGSGNSGSGNGGSGRGNSGGR